MTDPPSFSITQWRSPLHNPLPALIDALNAATVSIDGEDYGFTYLPVIQALVAAKARGVKVRMILDRSQAAGHVESTRLPLLTAGGVPFVEGRSEKGGIIHLKTFIIDSRLYFTGSFNVTDSAIKESNDSFMMLWPDLIAQRQASFAADWQRLGGAV